MRAAALVRYFSRIPVARAARNDGQGLCLHVHARRHGAQSFFFPLTVTHVGQAK